MPILRLIDAAFRLDERTTAGPINVELGPSQACALALATPRHASVIARMAAGLVKPTGGMVLVGDFDPKVQPVQAKRLVGFVPASPGAPPFKTAEDYFRFRADLWEIDRASAIERGMSVLATLSDPSAPYAFALAGALIHPCALVVLDQPALEHVAIAARQRCDGTALLTTHAHELEAQAVRHLLATEPVGLIG